MINNAGKNIAETTHNFNQKEIDTFWKYVNKDGRIQPHVPHLGKCWERISSIQEGYSRFPVNGKTVKAHRFSWILHFGEIPNSLCVLHKCDNRCCVNPNHLFLGTPTDNVFDCIAKNRNKAPKKENCWAHNDSSRIQGSNHGRSKLNESQAIEIRNLADSGQDFHAIAKKFDVCRHTVFLIFKRKTWRHV
jgi:hypothetical protein